MKSITIKTVGILCDVANSYYSKAFSQKYIKLANVEGYTIFSDGNVVKQSINSKGKVTRKTLKQTIDSFGYKLVTIEGTSYYVHRLVAIAFIQRKHHDWNVVCHKNKDRGDNRVTNIMWTNNNFINIRRTGFGAPNKGRKIIAKQLDGSLIGRYTSGGRASTCLGVNRSEIYRCCKGERKSAGGYKFEYAPETESKHGL